MATEQQRGIFRETYDAYVESRERYERELLAVVRGEKAPDKDWLIELASDADRLYREFIEATAPFVGGKQLGG
ncbi:MULTISPECIES: hypothetical protein [Burkholderia]|uniref:hypothetical protein n=1 Tax=Burkholderia TaxID=32008 RepID=UPI00158CA093|nr:hypothetical protein [Burkholderia ambifaria]